MGVITNIIQKKENSENYQIYIDNQFAIVCNIEIIKRMKLKVGKAFTLEEIVELKHQDDVKKGYNKALDYLTRKARTSVEIENHLKDRDFCVEVIKEVLEKLKYYQFIDDKKYIEAYIKDQCFYNLKGRKRIQQELIDKQLDKELVLEKIGGISSTEEYENALKIAKKAFIQNIKKPLNQNKEKIANKLYSKGYSWEIIHDVMNNLEGSSELMEMVDEMEENYLANAIKEGKSYYEKYSKKADNEYILKSKVTAALYKKGFDNSLIQKAINEILQK
ncbi:RecX family transcriptional regulator [Alkaliphilus serpentinus]|uniref:Regulatory protein RecX n=1 Tax=Alkaliphilus serpentinus TaxID=1482731 RepID=A0A833M8V1_9FIRM|nr:RecX family transcriptional regulator [Alkaliphilus serpentinus]KAB3527381.1 hypothetical protein F8153_12365 [Alkaliphilus serpentinus]